MPTSGLIGVTARVTARLREERVMNRYALRALLRAQGTKAFGAIGGLAVVAVIAACGGSSAVPGVTHNGITQTPQPAAASPSPTVPPAPPVVAIAQQGANGQYVLQAMDPSGTPLWSVPYSQASGPGIFVAGSRIFEVDSKAKQGALSAARCLRGQAALRGIRAVASS